MKKPGNRGNMLNSAISAKVNLTDAGILLFMVEIIAENRPGNTNSLQEIKNSFNTASVELPVSGSTILSNQNGFDKANFSTRFLFTCIKIKKEYCVVKWLTSLN